MKNPMLFFAPDEGDGKGGSEGLSRGAAAVEIEPPTGAVKEPEEKVVETPSPPAVDAEKLAKAMGRELSGLLKPAEPAAKTIDTLTPEEAEKILNVWKPSKEWVTKFDNLETREAALKELRDGFIKHSDTITQHRLHELQDSLGKKYDPVLKFMESYQNEQAEKRFGEKYPDLSKPTMMKVVKAVADDLKSKGKTFESEDELFDALAKGTEEVIKVHNPNFKLSAGSNPATTTKDQSANAIPVTTPGAAGGGGGKGAAADKPRGLAIFER
jgi:hypothetical protein